MGSNRATEFARTTHSHIDGRDRTMPSNKHGAATIYKTTNQYLQVIICKETSEMTSKEFIKKALDGTTKKTSCSSVFVDGDGTVYSYGYHYPLVKLVTTKSGQQVALINDRGYSVTTGKHIGWAFSAAAEIVGWDNCYHAPLTRGGSLDNPVDVARGSLDEQDRLAAQMAKKKRKDTSVYAWLQTLHDRTTATLKLVEEL